MSLQSWLQNSWLVQHTTSPEEIKNLLAISDRDLLACQVKQLPADWRCTTAYNAALQAATAALAAAGYRAARDNHLLCGRYRLSRRKQLVEEYFDSVSGDEDWSPRYNIAPTQLIPVIRQHPKEPVRELSLIRWGLIPSWAKDASGLVVLRELRVLCDWAHDLPNEMMSTHGIGPRLIPQLSDGRCFGDVRRHGA